MKSLRPRLALLSILICSSVLAFSQAPTIASVTPTTAVAGTQVTIAGSGFGANQGSGNVWLGSAYGVVVSWSDAQVVATVASGAKSGTAQVLQGGVWSNSVNFTVSTPNITTVTPSSAVAGTQVTITGSGFGANQGSGNVWLGSAYGVVVSWSDAQVVATVASGAKSGTAQVLQGGVWSNSVNFTIVGGLTITGVSPTMGTAGMSVTISGSGFGSTQGGSQVSLSGVALNVTGWSDSSIIAVIPDDSTSGPITVSTGQASSNSANFQYLSPVIASISPSTGGPSMSLTVSGSNFGATQGNSALTINGISASVNSWSKSSIQATTPYTSSGPVTVTVAGIASNSVQFTFVLALRGQDMPLYITPDESTTEVGLQVSLKVVDSHGTGITNAAWSVDDPSLASIQPDTVSNYQLDTATLFALAPGTATVTAESPLGVAKAQVTVHAGGATPPGTAAWSIYPDNSSDFIDSALKAHSSSNDGPYLFSVEGLGSDVGGIVVRAVDGGGQTLWKYAVQATPQPGNSVFPVNEATTKDGGLVLEYVGSDVNANEFMKLNSDATLAWTTSMPQAYPSTFAVSDTGNIFYKYSDNNNRNYFAVINGNTGSQVVSPAPQNNTETFTSAETTKPPNCASEVGPQLVFNYGSQILTDPILILGDAYSFTGTGSAQFTYTECGYSPNGSGGNFISYASGALASSSTLYLAKITPDGSETLIPITAVSYNGQATYNGFTFQPPAGGSLPGFENWDVLVPDGYGGLLIFWWQSDSSGQLTCNLGRVLNDSLQYTVASPGLVGANGICSYPVSAVSTDDSIVYLSMSDGNTYAFDVNQQATLWSTPGEATSATADDGVFISTGTYGSYQTAHVNQSGANDSTSFNSPFAPGYLDTGLFLSFNTYGAAQLIQSDQTLLTAPAIGWGHATKTGGDNARSRPLGKFKTPNPANGECAKGGLDDSTDPSFAVVPANSTDGNRTIIVHLDKTTPPAALTITNGSFITVSPTALTGSNTTLTITGNGKNTDAISKDEQHPTLTVTQGNGQMVLRMDVKSRLNQSVGLFGLYYTNLPAPLVQSNGNFPALLATELAQDLTTQANVYFTYPPRRFNSIS